MASIQFGQGTTVPSSWLQDVNDLVYGLGAPQNIINFFQGISTDVGAEIVGYSPSFSYPGGTVGAALQAAYQIPAPPAVPATQVVSSVVASLDETGNHLIFTAKYSNGTVKTATLVLS